MNQTILTENGLEKLRETYRVLKEEKLKEAIAQMKKAQEDNNCDLSENNEYIDACNELNRIESKMSEIQDKFRNLRVIKKEEILNDGKIKFGCTVELLKVETEQLFEFTIVGTEESDIKSGLLSYQAPIAKEMMRLEEGDFFDCQNNEYEILKVSIK